jgi:ribosomal-protein-serine acetyltransferase
VSRPFLVAGDGIEIRRLDADDAEALQRVVDRNRDRLRMWMWWADGSTVETTRAFIQAAVDGELDDPLGLYAGGIVVGAIGLSADRITGNREIGYWVGEAYEGRGIVTRACRVLISHTFAHLGCHRITIRAATQNTKSRAVAERLGFTHEGTLREAATNALGYYDMEVYGLLEHEWSPS